MTEDRPRNAVGSSASDTIAPSAAKPAILPDPVYEFSAPRYYDFARDSTDQPDAERADVWFDTAGTTCKYLLVSGEQSLLGKGRLNFV